VVIVLVIIGLIAAIAVPRLSRGAGAGSAALQSNLQSLRKAIELYRVEHGGAYPTCVEGAGNKTTIMFQLTQYTDAAGNYAATRSATHRVGPYLRQIPKLGVTDRRDRGKINTTDAGGVGWIYDPATGDIRANTVVTATDNNGRLYSSY
jgi:type II secretory pathway pseudopilin PulG